MTSVTIPHVCHCHQGFKGSVNTTLDLVCLRFIRPCGALFSCLSSVLMGLRYFVCTVMARPQQVGVQIQEEEGGLTMIAAGMFPNRLWLCSKADTCPALTGECNKW